MGATSLLKYQFQNVENCRKGILYLDDVSPVPVNFKHDIIYAAGSYKPVVLITSHYSSDWPEASTRDFSG